MENIVQKFYNLTSAFGSYPYKINLLPGTLDFHITAKRKAYLWKLSVVYLLFHGIKTNVSFVLNVKTYFESNDFLKLMFHCLWSITFIVIFFQHLCFIFHKGDVLQLCNGSVLCMQNFEKGKRLKSKSNVSKCDHSLKLNFTF